MPLRLSNKRLVTVLLLFALTFVGLHLTNSVKEIPIKQSLSGFPTTIMDWRVVRKSTFEAPVIALLGVTDYISYDYANENRQLLNFYISYFNAVGVTGEYHSPQNCLPGGGWNLVSVEDVTLPPTNAFPKPTRIRKAIVQKAADRQIVLYWYQNRGRIISSEYWEKIYLVLDAIFKQRRDGSFIRIMGVVPKGVSQELFTREMLSFAQNTMQIATEFLPGAHVDSALQAKIKSP